VVSRSDTTAGAPGVPLLDLSAQWRSLRDETLAAITRVCDTQRFILGAEVEALERELAGMLRVDHAIGVSSGTDALVCSLMALGVGPGDEVITSTYSFFATAGSIARLGATPVLVDIDPDTYNLDVAAIAAAITANTKAIMPVHLFGQCADMDAVIDVASRAGVTACPSIVSVPLFALMPLTRSVVPNWMSGLAVFTQADAGAILMMEGGTVSSVANFDVNAMV
jgi:hypothetical protein